LKKSLTTDTPQIDAMRAVTDQMTKEASVIPIREGGRGFVLQQYVKGGSWLLRSMAPYWSADEVWLDK
jgi:hypothetical protein